MAFYQEFVDDGYEGFMIEQDDYLMVAKDVTVGSLVIFFCNFGGEEKDEFGNKVVN